MEEFFESTTGKIIRAILFIPVSAFVLQLVVHFSRIALRFSGSIIGDFIFPYTFGVIAGVYTAVAVYPGKNKMFVVYGYVAVFLAIFFAALYIFATTDKTLEQPFLSWMNILGSGLGYGAIWYYLKDPKNWPS